MSQLERILADPAGFQPLVEQNYARLIEIGTWDARVATLREQLASVDYSITE